MSLPSNRLSRRSTAHKKSEPIPHHRQTPFRYARTGFRTRIAPCRYFSLIRLTRTSEKPGDPSP